MGPVGASERWDRCSEKGWPGGRHGEASEFAVAGATGSDGTTQRRLQEGYEDEDTPAVTGIGVQAGGGERHRGTRKTRECGTTQAGSIGFKKENEVPSTPSSVRERVGMERGLDLERCWILTPIPPPTMKNQPTKTFYFPDNSLPASKWHYHSPSCSV